MDSMMAVEIKHRIEGSLKVDVSVLELLQGTTVMQLAARILSSLQLDASPKLDVLPVVTDNTLSIVEIQQLIEQTDREELERLLAELEQVSENEASV
jgi:hypothetical protein